MFALWVLFCRNLTQRSQRPPVPVLVASSGPRKFRLPESPSQNSRCKTNHRVSLQKNKPNETLSQTSGANSKTNRGTGGKEEHDTSENAVFRFTISCRQSDAQFCHRVDSQNQAMLSEPTKGLHPKAACPLPPPVGRHLVVALGCLALPGAAWPTSFGLLRIATCPS